MKLLKVTLKGSKESVYYNPLYIKCIFKLTDGGSLIIFALKNTAKAVVEESVEYLLEKLDKC